MPQQHHEFLRQLIRWLAVCCFIGLNFATFGLAQSPDTRLTERELTLESQFWLDEPGNASIDQIAAARSGQFQPMEKHRGFTIPEGSALWLRLDLPAMPSNDRWFIKLTSGTFVDKVYAFQRSPSGVWQEQRAGDHMPVANWDIPDQSPVFLVDLRSATTVWVRLQNNIVPVAPRLQLLKESSLAVERRWSFLLLGGYFGFGLLVLFLGLVHARLYKDQAFVAYSAYVGFMLLFQLSFTGIGGLYFWPNWPVWNNLSPAIFMLLLTATGIWFVREALTLRRQSQIVDKAVMVWVFCGLTLAAVNAALASFSTFAMLNLYGLISVILSITLCIWVWRRGERYGGWLFWGFLPVHLGYPFPALRSTGLLADNWLSQYAVLIGSAVEIPLLLYLLHRRAKELGDNSARMRAIDHTDPLTGLPIEPVLKLRLRDALKREAGSDQHRCFILVELANHAEIADKEGHAAADRALVVAASCLLGTCHELDTICRIDVARFAILIEKHLNAQQKRVLAQRIVARGLSEFAESNETLPLRLRVVTTQLNAGQLISTQDQPLELEDALRPLVEEMNELARESRKSITHLSANQSGRVTTQVSAA